MPTGYLEPPYAVPNSDLYRRPAIGRVAAASGSARLEALIGDPPPNGDIAERYWAALTAAAGHRPSGAAPAQPTARTVIPQRDTLTLHRRTDPDNPFEGLIEHVLHVRLPHDER